jgi:hypothetical protein
MPNTMTLISSSTVGAGGVSSIDFTSIPSSYTDLWVMISGRGSAASISQTLLMSINGLTTNRNARAINGNGSGVTSTTNTNTEVAPLVASTATANTFTSFQIYLPNYSGSSNKSFSVESVNEDRNGTALSVFRAGVWSSTAAINQITFTPDSGTFVQYTTAYLYGVKNA